MSGVQRPVSPKARLNYKPAYFSEILAMYLMTVWGILLI